MLQIFLLLRANTTEAFVASLLTRNVIGLLDSELSEFHFFGYIDFRKLVVEMFRCQLARWLTILTDSVRKYMGTEGHILDFGY